MSLEETPMSQRTLPKPSESAIYIPKPISRKHTIGYGLGTLADQMSHQFFQFLIFTYYYAVVKIPITTLMWGFIIFAVWDAINDPLIGPITDRTKSKYGKRGFWILVSIIPFGIANAILFMPPYAIFGDNSLLANSIFFILSVMFYDLVYSFFSVNQLSLFSEQFITEKERGTANAWKSVLTIVGVIIGMVVPTLFIKNLVPSSNTAPPEEINKILSDYIIAGVVIGAFTILAGILFFKVGMVESRRDDIIKVENNPSIPQMLKDTFSNSNFIIFCVANLIKWFVFKMLTTIVPLYAINVLGIVDGSIMISVLLLTAFISAAVCFPLMKKLGMKLGWRNAFITTQIFWVFALIPFWFLDNQPYLAILAFVFLGVGLSGAMYYIEPMLGNIIDEDEMKTGKAKAGSYYGVNGLINRFSTILVFVVIGIVLSEYGWEQYLVGENLTGDLITGLKLLMGPISMAGCILVVILLSLFTLHGKRLKEMQNKLALIRKQRIQ